MTDTAQAVTDSGMSMQELHHRVRQEILIAKLRQQEVMSKVVITNSDVSRYLQDQALRNKTQDPQYRLRQIVIHQPVSADFDASAAARRQAESLRQQLVSGQAQFAALARTDSQGPHADSGGELGWLDATALPARYANVVVRMQPGDISPVVRGPNGFYIMQLEAKRSGDKALDKAKKVMVAEARMRHILLKPNAIRNDQRTRELARQIRERLQADGHFAQLARQYSDDSATADQGGDVGWVRIDQLDPNTRRQVAGLKKGQISHIFQDASGYEIVKIEARRQRDETKQARRNKARQSLGTQRAGEKGQLWLRQLRDEAYVDIRMPDYQPTTNP